jgi:hypothetical protein
MRVTTRREIADAVAVDQPMLTRASQRARIGKPREGTPMKALYALVFVCMAFHASAAPVETPESTTANDHLTYLDDFDYLDVTITGETTAQAMTRVPGVVIAPAIAPETLFADEDGFEYHGRVDTVPGVTTIPPSDEDPTGSFVDPWDGH